MVGVFVQAVAVAWVHATIRGEWLRRPGALMLLAAVVFHGVTEVMQAVWPGRNFFRTYVDQRLIDDWMLLVSAAVACYALAYGLFVVRSRRVKPAAHAHHEVGLARLRLPWLLLLAMPLLVATSQGKGALQPLAPGATRETSPNAVASSWTWPASSWCQWSRSLARCLWSGGACGGLCRFWRYRGLYSRWRAPAR